MALKSKRQKLIDKINVRFKTIAEVGGYETEIGSGIEWWVMPAIDPNALPKVCLKDRDNIAWGGIGEHLHNLAIQVEIYLKPTYTEAAQVMRQVIADITTCIGKDVTWDGLAEDTSIPDEQAVHIEERENCFVAIGIFFTVSFLTEPWSAYA